MTDQNIVLVTLVAYLAVVALVGILAKTLVQSSDDFFRAGGRMPWWTAGVSLYMGTFSAFAFVAFGSVVFEHGAIGIVIGVGSVIGWLVAAFYFAPRWRRARLKSPTEYLEFRFSAIVRQVVVWLNLVLSPLQSGLRLFAFSIMVHGILGYPLPETIIVTALVMMTYSVLGGLWAVVLTDSIQLVVLVTGLIPLLILSVAEVDGLRGLAALQDSGFFSFERGSLSLWWLGTWWFTEFINTLASFQGVQRYSSVADERDASKAAYLAAILLVPTMILALLPSLLGSHIFPEIDGEMIFAHMVTNLLPASIVGLMLGAMCAATMSSLDSIFNVDASLMTNDIYKRFLRPNATTREMIIASRLFTLLVVILAVTIALTLAAFHVRTFSFLEVIQSRIMVVVWTFFVLGILFRSISSTGFLMALGASLVFSAVLATTDLAISDVRIANIVFSIAVFSLANYWAFAMNTGTRRSKAFFAQLEMPVARVEREPGTTLDTSPLKLISISIMAFAAIPTLLISVTNEQGWGVGLEAMLSASLWLIGLSLLWASKRKAR